MSLIGNNPGSLAEQQNMGMQTQNNQNGGQWVLPSEIGGALGGLFGGGGGQQGGGLQGGGLLGGGQQPQLGGSSFGGMGGASMPQYSMPQYSMPQAQPMFSQFSMPQTGGFDAGYYMRNNPDVAQAVWQGQFDSPRQHYRLNGRGEGRQGAPGVENRLSPGLGQQFGRLYGSGILSALGGWGTGNPSRTAADYRQPYGLSVQAQQQEAKLQELQQQLDEQLQMRAQRFGSQGYLMDRGGGNGRGGAPSPGGGGPGGPSGSGHTGPDGPAGSGMGRF